MPSIAVSHASLMPFLRIFLITLFSAVAASAAESRVLILGDSITWDGRWATRVESALRATPQFAEAEIVNMGVPSETVSGLSEEGHAGGKFPRPDLHERLERVLHGFKPTLVLSCYGMNDGIFLPVDEARLAAFRKGTNDLKTAVEQHHARWIAITPPVFSIDHPAADRLRYDATLDAEANALLERRKDGWRVIDIRLDLRREVATAKQANPAFVYAPDKVHPGDDGHRFIADSINKQLWPMLKLTGQPQVASEDALRILGQRSRLLRDAWLSETKHQRPGLPAGLPIVEAQRKAVRLLEQYRTLAAMKTLSWNGFERVDLKVDGRNALLVKPKSAAKGKPWIWRTEFFGHEPQADLQLLEKGFHVAYIDMRNLYGGPQAMRHMDALHEMLTQGFGLSKKVVLEGFSRGGLFAFNWAARHPEFTAGLYVDAPVCDFKSWPGGKGGGPGAPADWQRLLKVYEFTEAQALAYPLNPVDNLAPLAKAKVPVFAVIGAADEIVPVSENIDLVEKRYKELGGVIEVIRKPGGKHHPHSLPDPAPIVTAILGFPEVQAQLR